MRCKLALDGLKKFEKILKVVIIENCNIDWIYDCDDSKTHFVVKMMKTKLGRCLTLFKGKYQIIFEPTSKGIETIATCEKYKEEPIILLKGLPHEGMKTLNLKNVIYVNYNSIDEQISANPKAQPKMKQNQVKTVSKKTELLRGAVEASSEIFKGVRESLDAFKVDNNRTLNVPGQSRDFLKDLRVIGQFDKKAILAKRSVPEFDEIWMFDQHACAERINLETLMRSSPNLSRDEMNMKACRSAIKFGDQIDLFQQEEIIKQLEKCQEPFHCAHGRPTCWLLAKIRK